MDLSTWCKFGLACNYVEAEDLGVHNDCMHMSIWSRKQLTKSLIDYRWFKTSY